MSLQYTAAVAASRDFGSWRSSQASSGPGQPGNMAPRSAGTPSRRCRPPATGRAVRAPAVHPGGRRPHRPALLVDQPHPVALPGQPGQLHRLGHPRRQLRSTPTTAAYTSVMSCSTTARRAGRAPPGVPRRPVHVPRASNAAAFTMDVPTSIPTYIRALLCGSAAPQGRGRIDVRRFGHRLRVMRSSRLRSEQCASASPRTQRPTSAAAIRAAFSATARGWHRPGAGSVRRGRRGARSRESAGSGSWT